MTTSLDPEGGRRRWAVLAVVSAAQLLIVLDLWVVNIALPALQHDFAPATLADVSWILDVYAIVLAALLLPAGRAADSIGRRQGFLAGLVMFGGGAWQDRHRRCDEPARVGSGRPRHRHRGCRTPPPGSAEAACSWFAGTYREFRQNVGVVTMTADSAGTASMGTVIRRAVAAPAAVRRAGTAGPGLAARAVPALAGLALGLLALGPGLRRGFLLSYDMVVVPRQPFTPALAGLAGGPPRAVPSDAVVAAASRVPPADLAQKLLLLSIFVLACSGAAALLAREPWFARLAGGVFYAWNPFVAERLIIGQWALLLGYAGLPWALRAITTCPVASWRGAGRLGLALLPAIVGGFAAMTISALVVLPAAILARPVGARQPVGERVRAGATALGVLAVGSLPWLIPSLLRPVYADPAGVAAFAARADTPFGSLGSLLMLGGVWNAQAVPTGYGGWWSALWLALVLAAAAGYVAFGLRRHRWPGLTFAAVAGLAIASVGVTAAGRGLLRAAVGLWPGFAVVWDAQQLVAPLALAEAIGAGLLAAWAARAHATAEHHQPRAGRPGV